MSLSSKIIITTILSLLTLASCGIFDFRPVIVETSPGAPLAVLGSDKQPVAIIFNSAPERSAAERLLIVKSPLGNVEGDFTWSGATLYFTPVKPWQPTVRYRMLCKGTVPMEDGREARLDVDLPFYALRDGMPPHLLSYSPVEGSSVDPAKGGGLVFIFSFSEAMDTESVRRASSFRPSIEVDSSWNAARTVLTLSPKNSLEPCAYYSWSIGADACSTDGAPFPRRADGRFDTMADSVKPEVLRCYPVIMIDGIWQESIAGAVLGDIRVGDAIAVQMSKAIDPVSAASAIRVEPSCPGKIDQRTPELLVFVPERPLIPQASMSIAVSPDIKDGAGLQMAKEYLEFFSVKTQYLRIAKIEAGGSGESIDFPISGSTLPVGITIPDGLLSLSFTFSESFTVTEQIALNGRIAVAPFFPSSLPAVTVRGIGWSADGCTMFLDFEGFQKSGTSIVNYYSVTIPGGSSGIAARSGVIMEKDLALYLEAKP